MEKTLTRDVISLIKKKLLPSGVGPYQQAYKYQPEARGNCPEEGLSFISYLMLYI